MYFFLTMRIVVLVIRIMLYITFLVLIHLVTGLLVPFYNLHLIPLPLSPPPRLWFSSLNFHALGCTHDFFLFAVKQNCNCTYCTPLYFTLYIIHKDF